MKNVIEHLRNIIVSCVSCISGRGLFIVSLLMVAVLSLCSCHRENDTDRLLAEIEEQMRSDTVNGDSVLKWLDSIPESAIDTPYRQAIYDCLVSRAKFWSGVYDLDDSLVSRAIGVFRDKNDIPRLIQALIHRGYLNLNKHNTVMGMSDAMEGLEYAEMLDDSLLMAMAEQLIATNYSSAYRADSALVHHLKSADLFSKIGHKKSSVNEYMTTAVYMGDFGRLDEAISLMDSVISVTADNDSITRMLVCNRLMRLYTNAGKLKEAESAFRQSLSYMNGKMYWPYDWRYVVEMYYSAGKRDSVMKYLEVLKDNYYGRDGNWHYYTYNQRLAADIHDYEQAYRYFIQADSIMKCRVDIAMSREPLIAVNDFHNSKSIEQATMVETRNTVILVILVSSIIIILLLIVIYVNGKKRQREKEMMRLMEISDLKEQLNSKKIDTSLAELLFKSGVESLDVLTTEYFRTINAGKSMSDSLYRNIDRQLDKLRSEEALDRLSEKIDLLYDGSLSKLADALPSIKKGDIHFIALKMAGFSPKSICLFLNLSPTNYYTKWQRIRNRVAETSIELPV